MIRASFVASITLAVVCAACADASKKNPDTTKATRDSVSAATSPAARPKPKLKLDTPDTSASIGEIVNAPTIMRDSAFGPKVGIDKDGHILPIKK